MTTGAFMLFWGVVVGLISFLTLLRWLATDRTAEMVRVVSPTKPHELARQKTDRIPVSRLTDDDLVDEGPKDSLC